MWISTTSYACFILIHFYQHLDAGSFTNKSIFFIKNKVEYMKNTQNLDRVD